MRVPGSSSGGRRERRDLHQLVFARRGQHLPSRENAWTTESWCLVAWVMALRWRVEPTTPFLGSDGRSTLGEIATEPHAPTDRFEIDDRPPLSVETLPADERAVGGEQEAGVMGGLRVGRVAITRRRARANFVCRRTAEGLGDERNRIHGTVHRRG